MNAPEHAFEKQLTGAPQRPAVFSAGPDAQQKGGLFSMSQIRIGQQSRTKKKKVGVGSTKRQLAYLSMVLPGVVFLL